MTSKFDANSNESIGKKDRRTVLKRLLGIGVIGWLVSIAYPIFRYLIPPPTGEANISTLQVGTVDDVWEEPYKIFPFGKKPGILFKDANGDYRALSATCTHLACIVQYQADDHFIWCACHNAKFGENGTIISGPPPRPLEEFTVNVTSNGEIWVTRKEV